MRQDLADLGASRGAGEPAGEDRAQLARVEMLCSAPADHPRAVRSEARDPPGPALADERERRRAVLLARLELHLRARPRAGDPHRLDLHVDAVGVADRLVHDRRAPAALRGQATGERPGEELVADAVVLAVLRRVLEVDDSLGGVLLSAVDLAHVGRRARRGLAAGDEGGAGDGGGERGSRRAWRHPGPEATYHWAGWP